MIQIGTQPENTETRSDEPHGVIEHVGSGRRQAFVDARELLEFLRADHGAEPKEVDR